VAAPTQWLHFQWKTRRSRNSACGLSGVGSAPLSGFSATATYMRRSAGSSERLFQHFEPCGLAGCQGATDTPAKAHMRWREGRYFCTSSRVMALTSDESVAHSRRSEKTTVGPRVPALLNRLSAIKTSEQALSPRACCVCLHCGFHTRMPPIWRCFDVRAAASCKSIPGILSRRTAPHAWRLHTHV